MQLFLVPFSAAVLWTLARLALDRAAFTQEVVELEERFGARSRGARD